MRGSRDNEGGRTLADYLRLLRRRGLWILAFVVLGVGAGFAYTSTQDTTYAAEASLLFQDPNEDLTLTGTAGGVFRTADQRAQIGADTIVTPELAAKVKRQLHTKLTAQQVKNNLSASADAASSEVKLRADAPAATLAASLANAAARIAAHTNAGEQRRRYSRAADELEQRVKHLPKKAESVGKRVLYNEQITRLRALSTLVHPILVSKRATRPSSPVSPDPARNAVIGGVLGLILGLLAAIGRESLDRRLSSTGDVEHELDVPLLAHVGSGAMGKAGVSKSGLGALSPAELEAFRILRTQLRARDISKPPRLVLVTSPMREEGKSTVAASLAFSYAMAGRRTLLLECDLRRPALTERLGVRPAPGLIDYLLGEASVADVVQPVPDAPSGPIGNGGSGRPAEGPLLSAIVAGRAVEGHPAELLEKREFVDLLQRLRTDFEAVIVDTPPLLPVADTLDLVPHVDAILLCVRASRTTRDQAAAGRSALEPVKDRLVGAVVTGVSPRDRGYYGYYGYYSYRTESADRDVAEK